MRKNCDWNELNRVIILKKKEIYYLILKDY